jgi:hypothetical protein
MMTWITLALQPITFFSNLKYYLGSKSSWSGSQ